MPNRTFMDKSYSLAKGEVRLYCDVTADEVGTTIALQEWNYPQLGMGTTAPGRTYTAAPTTGGSTSWPSQHVQGAEGIFSVTRTAVGLWTVVLQDANQRLLAL